MVTTRTAGNELNGQGARAQVAQRIAVEVTTAHALGQTRKTKVTTLRHAFRTHGSTSPDIREVVAALEAQGVEVRPVDMVRTGCVELALSDASTRHAVAASEPIIGVSAWSQGNITDEVNIQQMSERPEGVLWFNVDVPHGYGGDGDAVIQELYERLTEWCPGLEPQMLSDLIDEDKAPKVQPYGDESDGVRSVSMPAVIARETRSMDEDDLDGLDEELIFELVESLAAREWLITLWHPTRAYEGPAQPEAGSPLLREPIVAHVRYQWLEATGGGTAGDLGLSLARSLLNTYDASHRMIERWIETWELGFYGRLNSKDSSVVQHATQEISSMLSMVGESRRRLTAFQHERTATSDHSWYAHVSTGENGEPRNVAALEELLASTSKRFVELFETIRADMDLLMLRSLGTQQESDELLQKRLAKVTALVLVPALIAGIFGANTQLPGGGDWIGFELMVALMIISALVVYLPMRQYFDDRDQAKPATTQHHRKSWPWAWSNKS